MKDVTKEHIEQFIAIVEKVKDSRFRQQTQNIGFHLNFEMGQPLKQETTGFDENDLRSMLLDLRKVTLTNDGVFLPNICNLLIANSKDPETISNLKKCKKLYAETMEKPAVKMVINDKDETDVVKKWLYGHYFHEERSQEIQDLGFIRELHKMNFVVAISELIVVAAITANNAKVVLETL